MTWPLRIRDEAEADLEEAALWYESNRMRLGMEFLDAFERTAQAIAENPSRFPEVHLNIRRALLPRFPFGIFYLPTPSHIDIVAVFHASRNPSAWKART